ncbi:hypothetical protein [Flavobacterium kingsejongi]|uniref:Uncharacterized protein n=1 Tax=Flavobacterium kingsejongi TaxID=1678728 RepID=A0A2S1LMI3_9FLAO|nr:hypothetical protein [Flavobacterium kingsejongi]AWG24826.1 hypothetical protein FK004_06075 [Flavobacterium kingsejongi]
MATVDQIRTQLEFMAKAGAPPVTNIAQVNSVDEAAGTCDLRDEDGQLIFDVRLRPVLSGNKSFIQIPAIDSYVLAVRIEDDEDWMIIACDQVEKIAWYTGTTIFELTEKVHIESGGESLATLMDDLFQAISNMVFTTNTGPTINLVNALEFEALKTRFKTLLK